MLRPNSLQFVALGSLALLVGPVLLLVYEGFGPLDTPSGYSNLMFRSIALTVVSSAIASVVSVALFTPLSYYLARSKNRIAEALADIPAVVPHPIVGVAVLVLASPLTPFGNFLVRHGIYLFDSVAGMVIALTLVSAPIYIKSMQPYFESMSVSFEQFARGLGASRMYAFVSVVLPNSGAGVLSASLISMSRAMSEFGSVAIVAYYVVQGPTIGFYGVSPASVTIYNLYTSVGLGASVTASAVLILLSMVLLICMRLAKR